MLLSYGKRKLYQYVTTPTDSNESGEEFIVKFYYHVTFSENLDSIMKRGLTLQERTGDSFYPERTVKRIYLLDEPDYTGFYGDVILRIRIPSGVRVNQAVFAEGYYVTKPIPPKYISIHRRLRV